MNQADRLEKLPASEKKPLRIVLTFYSNPAEVSSLEPLWRRFLSPRMFEMAKRYSKQKGLIVESNIMDLSIRFEAQKNNAFVKSIIGVIFNAFKKRSLLGTSEAAVRGDLPDLMACSDFFIAWLSAGNDRRIRLESCDKIPLEIWVQKPEEVQFIFEAAVAVQAQES
ncbi:MAG: hypothetical protein LAO78_24885 [Acidobacteriia bacterium]|nr:hypothetical protein [Terriglobia bacterium]